MRADDESDNGARALASVRGWEGSMWGGGDLAMRTDDESDDGEKALD